MLCGSVIEHVNKALEIYLCIKDFRCNHDAIDSESMDGVCSEAVKSQRWNSNARSSDYPVGTTSGPAIDCRYRQLTVGEMYNHRLVLRAQH